MIGIMKANSSQSLPLIVARLIGSTLSVASSHIIRTTSKTRTGHIIQREKKRYKPCKLSEIKLTLTDGALSLS